MVKILYSNKMVDIEKKINECNEYREFSNYLILITETDDDLCKYIISKIYRIYKKYIMTLMDLDIIPLTNSNDLRYFAIMKGKETQEREEINYEKYKIILDNGKKFISKIIIEENGKEIIIDNEESIFERG